jgi:hypothetical protein
VHDRIGEQGPSQVVTSGYCRESGVNRGYVTRSQWSVGLDSVDGSHLLKTIATTRVHSVGVRW